MSGTQQARTDRFEMLYALLQRILREIEELKTDVDAMDRSMRPYGDGTRESRRR